MCRDNIKCAAFISLNDIGIISEGCMRDSNWLKSIDIQSKQSIFNSNYYIDMPDKKLCLIKNIAHGTFGSIDIGKLESNGKKAEVYVKRPLVEGKSLLYEACMQKLVGDILLKRGIPTGAPKVVQIFRLNDNSICFAMEPIANAITLQTILERTRVDDLSSILIDCLLQVCSMIWHLENDLGINHRDLKPSNLLVVEHEPKRKTIIIENIKLEIISRYSLSFIDFGFSCIGSVETKKADISLGTVYTKDDPCPKDGRDLYLFLAFLYSDLHEKLHNDLVKLFEKWLTIPGSNFTGFLKKYNAQASQWIYFITGNPDIKKFNCCPCKIVLDLQTLL
jgi:serine/threonine protein kinase